MAIGVTKVHGNTKNFGAVGRTVQVLSCANTDMTQAEIDALIQILQQTNSVTGVSEFVAGTTDTLYVAVEGPTVANDTYGAFAVTTLATFVTR